LDVIVNETAASLADSGLEVIDLESNAEFCQRPRRSRDMVLQLEAMGQIAQAFVQSPESVLQVLSDAAVALCGADSAGISIEIEDGTETEFYRWVATSGTYSPFLYAILPRNPSACGVCLDRGTGQIFHVTKRFFDILGVEALEVSDGLLLPWTVGKTRGTIFVMAHNRAQAFDLDDYRLMKVLADFAAMGTLQQRQQEQLLHQATAAAAGEMANGLAHKINNPLQGLTNAIYLVDQNAGDGETKRLTETALEDVDRLSSLVRELLALPFASTPLTKI
jgi:hypothetical protein